MMAKIFSKQIGTPNGITRRLFKIFDVCPMFSEVFLPFNSSV
jgi:hypothetical protein